jgi:hypothetical protein
MPTSALRPLPAGRRLPRAHRLELPGAAAGAQDGRGTGRRLYRHRRPASESAGGAIRHRPGAASTPACRRLRCILTGDPAFDLRSPDHLAAVRKGRSPARCRGQDPAAPRRRGHQARHHGTRRPRAGHRPRGRRPRRGGRKARRRQVPQLRAGLHLALALLRPPLDRAEFSERPSRLGGKKLVVGDGAEPGVTMGPLIRARARPFAGARRGRLDRRRAGCWPAGLGRPHLNAGHFLEPTVLRRRAPDEPASCRGALRPGRADRRLRRRSDEADRQANATEFGLAAYVFTNDIDAPPSDDAGGAGGRHGRGQRGAARDGRRRRSAASRRAASAARAARSASLDYLAEVFVTGRASWGRGDDIGQDRPSRRLRPRSDQLRRPRFRPLSPALLRQARWAIPTRRSTADRRHLPYDRAASTTATGISPNMLEAVKRGVLAAGALPLDLPGDFARRGVPQPDQPVFRNLMAMDVEEMIRAQPMDSVVLMGGCDKTVPAQLMGAVFGRPAGRAARRRADDDRPPQGRAARRLHRLPALLGAFPRRRDRRRRDRPGRGQRLAVTARAPAR